MAGEAQIFRQIPIDAALFLDFDGTLVEIAAAPSDVVVPESLPLLLDRLWRQLDGAIAIVSGRRVADIASFLPSFRGPIVGLHGLERRTAAGEFRRRQIASSLAEAREITGASLAGRDGVTIEDKEFSLAIHFRGAPLAAAECLAAAELAVARAKGALLLMPGKMLVEIGPRSMNKGAGIADIMREPPFSGRLPVSFGDDVTDEDGFIEINKRGGLSIHVGRKVDSAARFRLDDVRAVIACLTAFAEDGEMRGPRATSA
jgi:trehalose 6-phosphate phosphatase